MSAAAGSDGIRYHVQSTAHCLRDGFPYFEHHDTVSALWSTKWRAPCAAGLYPFTDGKLEDFDPIFAELVELSGDDPAFFHRPDDYARPFLPVAARLADRAEAALAAGQRDQAAEHFLRAAAVYRIARFPIIRSPFGAEAWVRGKEAFGKGAALLDPPIVPLQVPFTAADPAAGDAERAIEACLRVPAGAPPEAGWPVLLFICGLDSYRTDNTVRLRQHVERGFAALILEIPGTGDCPAAANDPASPDRLMSSVLDWIAAEGRARHLDAARVVARGISTGGYYAFRIAHTHADRLLAAVAEGGGCHHMFDPAWINAQDRMEYPFALAGALAWKFGYRDVDPAAAVRRYAAEAQKFSLVKAGLLGMPSCRMLAINGMEDSIFPIEDNFLVALQGTNKDLVARGNRGHMGSPGADDLLLDWIDKVAAGDAGFA